MLKILNFTRTLLGTITDYQDLEIIHSLQDGDEQISFKYLGTTQIKNEYYVQTDRARYTIKSAEPEDDGTEYHGLLDLEDLQRNVFKQFTSTGQTITAAAQAALENTDWTVSVDPSVTGTRNVQRFKKTPLDVLYALRDAWMCEIKFDNLNKVVYFDEEFGEDKGVYLMRGLNLRKVTPTIDTYDYVTRIIPYGADGLTISEVNEGIPYVENYQYSTKILTLIWEDTSYTDANTLKADAIKKLDDLSKPKSAYSCDVIALSKMSSRYAILDYKLGDTIYLHDPVVGVNEKQRIVKYNEHPENPEMDSVEISNVVLSFEELQSRMNAAAQAWEEVSNSDGTVNGVYVHGVQADDVVGIETVITENSTVQAGVTNVSVLYAQGVSPTVPPEDGWSTTAPVWDSGKYMWQRTYITHASGEVELTAETNITGAMGPPGQGGAGVSTQVTFYAVSPSNTVTPSTGLNASTEDGGIILNEEGGYVEIEPVWYVSPPERPSGWYIWMYIHTVFTDGTTTDSVPVCISGDDGNGIDTITEYYAVSSSSSVAPADAAFSTSIPTMTEEYPYLWNYEVIEYTYGTVEASEKRVIGVYGADGVGIESVTNYYLATSASSGVTKNTPGWTSTVQSVTSTNKYLWNYEVILFTDGSSSEDDPCIIGAYGDPGISITGVTNYYLATSASSGVTTSTPGWTTTIQTMTSTNQYLWNYEVITGSNSQTLNTSTPVIIGRYGQNGSPGRGISSITEYYAVSSSNTTAPTSWSTTLQNTTTTNRYLWNYETITYSDGTTEDSTKRVIGTHGATGDTGNGVASMTNYYSVSSSQTVAPPLDGYGATEGGDIILTEDGSYLVMEQHWGTSRPMKPENWFLWSFTRTTYTDGTSSDTLPMCISGADGTVIVDSHEQYYLSTSSSTTSGGAWYDEAPDYIIGRYYWTRTVTIFSNGIKVYSAAVLNMALTTANSKAATALESANGKNANFYQTSAPSSTGRKVGDLWFVMGTGDNAGKIVAMKEWTGSAWTETPLTSAVFAFIDAGKITTGFLSSILIKSDDNNYWNLSNAVVDGKPAQTLKTSHGDFTGDVNATSIAVKDGLKLYSAVWSAYKMALAIQTDDVYDGYPRIVVGSDSFGSIDFDFEFAIHMGALTITHNTAILNGVVIPSSAETFTCSVASGVPALNRQTCRKYGKVVTIDLWWQNLSITKTGEWTIATIPVIYSPPSVTWAKPISIIGSAGNYAQLTSAGNIIMTGDVSGDLALHFSYII